MFSVLECHVSSLKGQIFDVYKLIFFSFLSYCYRNSKHLITICYRFAMCQTSCLCCPVYSSFQSYGHTVWFLSDRWRTRVLERRNNMLKITHLACTKLGRPDTIYIRTIISFISVLSSPIICTFIERIESALDLFVRQLNRNQYYII